MDCTAPLLRVAQRPRAELVRDAGHRRDQIPEDHAVQQQQDLWPSVEVDQPDTAPPPSTRPSSFAETAFSRNSLQSEGCALRNICLTGRASRVHSKRQSLLRDLWPSVEVSQPDKARPAVQRTSKLCGDRLLVCALQHAWCCRLHWNEASSSRLAATCVCFCLLRQGAAAACSPCTLQDVAWQAAQYGQRSLPARHSACATPWPAHHRLCVCRYFVPGRAIKGSFHGSMQSRGRSARPSILDQPPLASRLPPSNAGESALLLMG